MSTQPSRKSTNWIKHLVGFGITGLCLLLFLRQVDFSALRKALVDFDWPYLFLGIFMLAFGYCMRIFRWSLMLRAAAPSIKMNDCITPFLGSITLNNILPLRLGDVVRALVFPSSMGIKKTTAVTSLVVERLIDLITLLASFAIGILAIRSVEIPAAIKTTAITLAIAGCAALLFGFLLSGTIGTFFLNLALRRQPKNTKQSALCAMVGELFTGFDSMSRPKLLFKMLAVSMLVWTGEAGLFYFILLGVGLSASPLVALLVMSFSTLSTLVPSSPGYVGPFHLAAFTAVTLVGGAEAQAGAYAVIVHLSLWIPTTLAGAVAIWRHPELFRSTKSQVI